MSVTQTYNTRHARLLRRARACSAGIAAGVAFLAITVSQPHHATAQSQGGLQLPEFYSFSGPEKITKNKKKSSEVSSNTWKKDALVAWSAGDYKTAHRIFKSALDAGHIAAAWHLGNMYRLGRGVERNPGKAFEYYQRVRLSLQSASLNRQLRDLIGDSTVHVADSYRTGIKSAGLAPDPHRAYGLYLTARSLDHPGADHGLGMMFLEGTGLTRNLQRAQQHFYRAATRGYIPSMTALGDLSFSAGNEPANHIAAAAWYLIALETNTDTSNEQLIKQHLDRILKAISQPELDAAMVQKDRWLDRYSAQPAVRSVSD